MPVGVQYKLSQLADPTAFLSWVEPLQDGTHYSRVGMSGR